MTAAPRNDLVDVRVIAEPEIAVSLVARLREVLAIDRDSGPYPSRKTQGLVRCYLAGHLRSTDAPALADQVERLERQTGRLRVALELLTRCDHGKGLDCPDCEPLPELVRQALEGEAVSAS